MVSLFYCRRSRHSCPAEGAATVPSSIFWGDVLANKLYTPNFTHQIQISRSVLIIFLQLTANDWWTPDHSKPRFCWCWSRWCCLSWQWSTTWPGSTVSENVTIRTYDPPCRIRPTNIQTPVRLSCISILFLISFNSHSRHRPLTVSVGSTHPSSKRNKIWCDDDEEKIKNFFFWKWYCKWFFCKW